MQSTVLEFLPGRAGIDGELVKAGFEIEFEPNEEREVDTVTLRLNDTWKAIMQRVMDRRTK